MTEKRAESSQRANGRSGGIVRAPGQGQGTDADSGLLENNDAARFERLSDARQVLQQQRDLTFGPPFGPTPEQDDRRLFESPVREDLSEVGVRRNEDSPFAGGAGKDCLVVGVSDSLVPDVRRIVSGPTQRRGNVGREGIVYEELQSATSSGSSRSRTASAA